jgi:hypothetical protein
LLHMMTRSGHCSFSGWWIAFLYPLYLWSQLYCLSSLRFCRQATMCKGTAVLTWEFLLVDGWPHVGPYRGRGSSLRAWWGWLGTLYIWLYFAQGGSSSFCKWSGQV